MKTSVAATLGASVAGLAGADVSESDTPGAPSVKGSLKRFSSTALGAEVTGPFVFTDGTLLYSLQHPSRDNPAPYDKAGIGYFKGFQFEMDGSNDDFSELSTPQTEAEQSKVRGSEGEYEMLAQQEAPINGGTEQLGVPQTPGGVGIDKFAGTRYSEPGFTPDCNQFIPTNEAGTEGYLFTNFETSPGNITRIPVTQTAEGEWSADLENAINLANTQPLRDLGGTRINCYGDRTPWNTMVSSEENYAHPRVSLTASVSDIVEKGTGEGLRGAHEFWNRPNPSGIQGAVNNYSDVDGWYVQGYWAATGVELLAYYLGADPVDQSALDTTTSDANGSAAEVATGNENTTTPIGDVYPNPYRYGYHLDFREPAADPPQPIKYYVMGRASWEAPDFQNDLRTVYGCSDGDSKGIYKFVADRPIPSYDDPMDVAGTLYAPRVANATAAKRNSPAKIDLEIEWMELGHATNAEVASWIADYDGITQVDYLETHAQTDWQNDLATAIKEADKEVIANGNQDYITDQEILDWAAQYEANGPDGVDENLRRVPFLETRAAAKEIGASIEFNKAEGVDSIENAGPGDFVYFGISEFNDDLANSTGDIRLDRVDGGLVYRAELEPDYNVSTLEPVITGPDGTDPADVADDALVNVDNVYVMDDGRVLCCEDADQLGQSYPNDCLYVYQPNTIVDVDSIAVGAGKTAAADIHMNALPAGVSGATLTLRVTDPEVATIDEVSFADALGLTDATVTDDGRRATIRFADLENNVRSGSLDVSPASIRLRGEDMGTTDVDVSVENLDDDAGTEIESEARSGVVAVGPSSIAGGATPTDPDGDGHYEDTNGNGRLDYDDIVLLFEEMDSDAVQLNKAAYDMNENGQVDYDDVVDLYEEM